MPRETSSGLVPSSTTKLTCKREVPEGSSRRSRRRAGRLSGSRRLEESRGRDEGREMQDRVNKVERWVSRWPEV